MARRLHVVLNPEGTKQLNVLKTIHGHNEAEGLRKRLKEVYPKDCIAVLTDHGLNLCTKHLEVTGIDHAIVILHQDGYQEVVYRGTMEECDEHFDAWAEKLCHAHLTIMREAEVVEYA